MDEEKEPRGGSSIQVMRMDIREIKRDMAEIKLALKGPFPPKADEQGLIGNMMYVLHQIDNNDDGLRARIRNNEKKIQHLENLEREGRAFLKGAMFVSGLAGAVIGTLVSIGLKYVLKL
jgi:hypothetical protein